MQVAADRGSGNLPSAFEVRSLLELQLLLSWLVATFAGLIL